MFGGVVKAGTTRFYTGLTLRDWFAGKALANAYTQAENNPEKVAEWAYQVADAMLRARSQGDPDAS
ncbi:hypothetical protein EX253_09255 [Alcaligenes faecalis]|nr:hypothetical protein [Providencia rettgeri]MBX7031166.1 hypothetical protein [Alcaligenes faecalis]